MANVTTTPTHYLTASTFIGTINISKTKREATRVAVGRKDCTSYHVKKNEAREDRSRVGVGRTNEERSRFQEQA